MIAAPAHMTMPNIGSRFYGEHEVSNDNDWIPVTSGHSYKLGYCTKYSTKYEKQPTGQHIGTFNRFVPLATQCFSNSAQPHWEVCTPKQTVKQCRHGPCNMAAGEWPELAAQPAKFTGYERLETRHSHKHNPTSQTFVRLDRHCVYEVTNTR
jgi:hypothetical protein